MGEGIQLDTSRPKIKGEGFNELKEIYTRFFQDVESIGEEVVNQIAECGRNNGEEIQTNTKRIKTEAQEQTMNKPLIVSISIKKQNNSYLANVQIDAVNKDNDDMNYIQLYINYYRNGLKYDKSLSGVVESSVYPNHNPTESDFFPLPDVLLEIRNSGETIRSSFNDRCRLC